MQPNKMVSQKKKSETKRKKQRKEILPKEYSHTIPKKVHVPLYEEVSQTSQEHFQLLEREILIYNVWGVYLLLLL
jgi:DNA-binding ferritin-like protein (Dps family)